MEPSQGRLRAEGDGSYGVSQPSTDIFGGLEFSRLVVRRAKTRKLSIQVSDLGGR